MQLFTLGSSKIKGSETYFLDIVTTQNDHPKSVKHVLGSIYVFYTLLGYRVQGWGWEVPKGWVHNLLMQFFNSGCSKSETIHFLGTRQGRYYSPNANNFILFEFHVPLVTFLLIATGLRSSLKQSTEVKESESSTFLVHVPMHLSPWDPLTFLHYARTTKDPLSAVGIFLPRPEIP